MEWEGTIIAQLKGATNDIKRNVGEAIQWAGQECEDYAKINAPVDTGELEASITYQEESELAAIVSTDVEYAIYQEMGTYKMAAHPFLIPALETVAPLLEERLHNL